MRGRIHNKLSRPLMAAAIAALSACGGGGGGGGGSSTRGPTGTGWVAGVYLPAANFAAHCAAPRTGIDPATSLPFPDVPGSALTENNWLRSWTNDLYLWYDEVIDRDPALYTTPAYFDLLKTTATTPSGNPKDKFHFTFDSSAWFAFSQSGVSASYGAE